MPEIGTQSAIFQKCYISCDVKVTPSRDHLRMHKPFKLSKYKLHFPPT